MSIVTKVLSGAVVLGLSPIVLAAEEDGSYPYGPVVHKTVLRETQGRIRTVWPDLRLDGTLSQAAMPLLGHGGLVWAEVSTERVIRKGREDADEGRRRMLAIGLEQVVLPNRVWFETDISAYAEAGDRDGGVGDWSGRFVVSVWKQRYHAVSIAIGSAVTVDAGPDLDLQHAEAWKLPTFQVGGRYSGAFGFWTLTSNLAIEFQIDGSTEMETPIVDSRGEAAALDGDRWVHRYGRVSVPVGISYRAFRWLRVGLDTGFFAARWDGEEDAVSIRDWGIPMEIYADFNPLRVLRMRAAIGRDPSDVHAVDRDSGLWSARAGLQVHW